MISRASGGFASSNQRRGVTPLVLLLKRSGNNSARSLTVVVRSNPEMNLGDAVGAVRPDDGKVGHPDVLSSGPPSIRLIRDAPGIIALKAALNLIEQPLIDFEDDFEIARNEYPKPLNGPFFESFWG